MVVHEARLEMVGELLFHNRGDYLDESVSRPSLETSVRLILLQHLLLPCVQGIGDKDPQTPFESQPRPCRGCHVLPALPSVIWSSRKRSRCWRRRCRRAPK